MTFNNNIYESGQYWEKHDHNSAFKSALVIETLRSAGIVWPNPVRLADLGCGDGTFLKSLCDHLESQGIAYDAQGYDIAPNIIARATEKYGRSCLTFHIGDSSKMNMVYDFVFVNDVVEHVENPYAFVRSLRNKAKWCIIHLPIEVSFSHILLRRPIKTYNLFGHLHFFSEDSARVLFQEAGFEVYHTFFSAGSRILTRFQANPLIAFARIFRRLAYSFYARGASMAFGGPIMFVLKDGKEQE